MGLPPATAVYGGAGGDGEVTPMLPQGGEDLVTSHPMGPSCRQGRPS